MHALKRASSDAGQLHGEKVNRTSAVLAAAQEVANPISFAIVIIIVVFLPLFSLQGLEGKMFKPMNPSA